MLDRGEVDIRLERRSGLAVGVRRTVELARAVVFAADHGAHGAVGFHRHERAVVEVP